MSESFKQQTKDFPITVSLEQSPFVNFAMQQNAVPLLRSITFENKTPDQLTNLRVRVWSDPPVLLEKTLWIDIIDPRSSYVIDNISLTLLRESLRLQTEREEGHLWIEVMADDALIYKQTFPLSVLAYNEWYGISSLPEIIVAHVLPNDPAVELILAEASQILKEKNRDISLSGYQTGDPRHAYTQAAAIYWAAARQKISYVNPPASFEETGQKIRTPEQLLTRKLGTCIDTTVLLAACFEQAGLRSMVILVEGHAFPGVWLIDKSFDDPVTRYASILNNRIALGELVVIESTFITKAPPPSFKSSQEHAYNLLQTEVSFRYAIDVKASRKIGIRPLSLTESVIKKTEPDMGYEPSISVKDEDLIAPDFVTTPIVSKSQQKPREDESAADRLLRWKTNLLDLTLRNRLLNFKDSKKSIPILCPDIAGLEDALANNEAFRVLPKPATWGDADPRNPVLHKDQTGEDAMTNYLHEEMRQRRLHTPISDRDLAARLTEIDRAARMGLEEGGANMLFLALGYLVWTEAETSEIERRAPIILVPMSLERKSMQDGFRIQRIDEESRINITLLQKLKVDFGISVEGLDPLPEDASGLDVPKILHIIRNAIKRTPRWKVIEEASLSILTFSRFLMWLDLEANAEELKQNAVVRHLVETPNEQFEPLATFPELENLDNKYLPSDTFCPLHADSSQLRAVFAAAEDRTFVLQGPPGTGKSQTITNLIAHCLTIGKRVLFVAQKRAALDVVHKRITDIGLGSFCLELHSNKTTRDSFRIQLQEALSVAGTWTSEHWESETIRLAGLRNELNEYIHALHLPRAFGKSAYWVISRLIGHQKLPKVLLDLGDPATSTVAEFERMRLAVRDIIEAVRLSGDPSGHPLSAVRLSRWTYGIEDELSKILRDTSEAYEALRVLSPSVLQVLELNFESASHAEFRIASSLTALLEHVPNVTQAILTEPEWFSVKAGLMKWIELGRGCVQRRSALLERYTESLFSLDLPSLINMLRIRKEAWFYKRWRLGSSVVKAVKTVLRDGEKPKDYVSLEQALNETLIVVEELAKLEEQKPLLSRIFGSLWCGITSDWDELQKVVEWTEKFRHILNDHKGTDLESNLKREEIWNRLATENRYLFLTGSSAAQQAHAFQKAFQKTDSYRSHITDLLQLDLQIAWGGETDGQMLKTAERTLGSLTANLPSLREWSYYQASRAVAIDLKLAGIVEGLEKGQINTHNLESVFENSFAEWWARKILTTIPSLTGFVGERHNLKIYDFRELEEKVAYLTRKEAFVRIAKSLPRIIAVGQRIPASSETGILQRFAQGGRKTIRRIFKECPNALSKYKPCVLMSPLSVAQFIGTDFPKFDIVVFDEASQLPTYEAIGTIARGKQLIVVGDSKQLPPTTFFERQKEDEEYDENDLPEELESILEEVEASGLTTLRLDWHYRSRHESLIAFSNQQYYDNRLHTFPSALAEHPRVGLHLRWIPDGVYDYGKSRTNQKEAEAIVDDIIYRLRDPIEQGNSIGIVTFSIPQQQLIEDLLDAAREKHPEIEPYFAKINEPVFIKNLETVQGDERDVILFSICYGPDAAGVIRMNFGPLNNKGGERRLNVAITRARKQLHVFSSIKSEQIDLSRTQAVGVQHLRTFLDYAKRGQVALIEKINVPNGEVESPFEQSVYDELIKDGWLVDKQVGCSGYRIDLAVRDPKMQGRFLMGIECDGAHYHSAKSARDRDRIRQTVLENLGWNLHRIWSTDWWLQRTKEIAKLEEALTKAKMKASSSDYMDLSPSVNIPVKKASVMTGNPSSPESSSLRIARAVESVMQKPIETISIDEQLQGQSFYQYYQLGKEIFTGEVYDSANAKHVRDIVRGIAFMEAPILLDSMCKRVASCWQLQRTGNRIRELINRAVKESGLILRRSGKREFIWTKELAEKEYEGFRIPSDSNLKSRQAHEICPEEIANAAFQVLKQHISMDVEDLSRETANVFRIRRLGPKVHESIYEGIMLLSKQGRCRLEGSIAIIS